MNNNATNSDVNHIFWYYRHESDPYGLVAATTKDRSYIPDTDTDSDDTDHDSVFAGIISDRLVF